MNSNNNDSKAFNEVNNKKIVVVGLCCLDIVSYVDGYPPEDSDRRVFEQVTRLGGNAANSVTVLRQVLDSELDENGGARACELFAAVPADCAKTRGLLNKQRVPAGRCILREDPDSPVSIVVVNRENGSRTIMHYRGTSPEPRAEEFVERFGEEVRAGTLGWVHFEGRNFDEVQKMMEFIRRTRPPSHRPLVSVELEKLRPFPCLEQLIPLADVLFMGKDFAKSKGWQSMEEAVDGLQREFGCPDTPVICPWAERGAAARASTGSELITRPALAVDPVVDTTGAGDAFIGAALCYLNEGAPLARVLEEANRVAGVRVAQQDLTNLPLTAATKDPKTKPKTAEKKK